MSFWSWVGDLLSSRPELEAKTLFVTAPSETGSVTCEDRWGWAPGRYAKALVMRDASPFYIMQWWKTKTQMIVIGPNRRVYAVVRWNALSSTTPDSAAVAELEEAIDQAIADADGDDAGGQGGGGNPSS